MENIKKPLGLQRGEVTLLAHQASWDIEAKNTIECLRLILKDVACDIQHVGSTAILSIHAKPIIDIAVGVKDLNDIKKKSNDLLEAGFIDRGSDILDQHLYVMGDDEQKIRTHHIHFVMMNGQMWKNYLYFRDYLNTHKDKAIKYNQLKMKLARKYPRDHERYTALKEPLIQQFLQEASDKYKGD